MIFLLDTNIFINAHNVHYRINIFPSVWNFFAETKEIKSIDKVFDEITKGDDGLVKWGNDNESLFLPTSSKEIQDQYRIISKFVQDEYEKQENINKFLGGADPWLIAYAIIKEATIVTFEKTGGYKSLEIKIPNICKKYGVKYIETYQLFEEFGAKF